MYISRAIEKKVQEVSNVFPVILITGPRQVGKTTLLKYLSQENRTYVTLDDPLIRQLAQEDPALFLQRYSPPILIDEIQYAPQLLPHIKMHVDKSGTKGDVWLTGSQIFYLMKNVSESLAGRVGILNLLGLSNSEINNHHFGKYKTIFNQLQLRLEETKGQSVGDVFQQIFIGSMPALYEIKQSSDIFYSSYVNTYIQRDIHDLTQVGDLNSFLRFLTNCAARTGQTVNYAEMAKDVGISASTVKRWLSILESTGLIYFVQPYFNNALKRIIKSPKLYFMDTGLCAYLTRWTSPEALEVSAVSGAFFETYVVAEIIKSYLNAGSLPPIYYYRDTDQKEIDLIIEENHVLYPIEIKKTANPQKKMIKHFSTLDRTGLEVGAGNVICLCNTLTPIDEKNSFVPVWLI